MESRKIPRAEKQNAGPTKSPKVFPLIAPGFAIRESRIPNEIILLDLEVRNFELFRTKVESVPKYYRHSEGIHGILSE